MSTGMRKAKEQAPLERLVPIRQPVIGPNGVSLRKACR
jgi:hypothetical protein